MGEIDDCRARLPIWELFAVLGLRGAEKVQAWGGSGKEAKICSPFREDRSPSFSVFVRDGVGFWKDFGTGESGDEIKLLEQARGLSTKDAIALYYELAGVERSRGGGSRGPARRVAPKPVEMPGPVRSLADKLEGVEVPKKKREESAGGRGEIVKVYDYMDEGGCILHQTLRMDPKDFRQRRPALSGDDPDTVRDGWVWSLKGSRVVPFRLPEILASAKSEPIFLVEGEKDVENLEALGDDVIATCLPMGAGKWREEFARYFAGRWVVIIPDFDKPGLEGAELVARALFEVADRVGVLHLESLNPAALPGQDVSDWLESEWAEERPVDDQYDVLMREAERAGVKDLDFYSGCLTPSKRDGIGILQDKLARVLVKVENLIFCGDSFWKWNGRIGIWEQKKGRAWIERKIRRAVAGFPDEVQLKLTANFVSSVVKLAASERVKTPEELNATRGGFFSVRNGVLDVERGKLLPHRAGNFATVQTPHVYDPGAECPKWLEWLEERQPDEETRNQIQEIFGYCLGTHINFHTFFFFYGDGGTGKSTCVDVLEWLVGDANKVSIELTELDNPFTRSQMVGKSLALCKELTSRSFKHIGLIKAIVSGDPVYVDVKYGTGYDFRPCCRVVMESNVLAMSGDSSAGFERRFLQVNFDKPIERSGMEYNFQERFKAEMSGILNWALAGYRRLKERGRFEHTERSQRATDDFKKHRAQVEMFLKSGALEERPMEDEKGRKTKLCVAMGKVFELYNEWCEEEHVVAFYKEKGPFARELFSKKAEWRERAKRRAVCDGVRDTFLMGIENVKVFEAESWED